jgi:hypothetical protein
MTNSEATVKKQYSIAQFGREEEAQKARSTLQEVGFPSEDLSIKNDPLDPAHGVVDSQVFNSIKGGLIAGATFGGLVGFSFLLIRNNLSSTTTDPAFNPLIGFLIGAIVGAVAIGLISAISGRNIPTETRPGTEGEAASSVYRVMLVGNRQDQVRATEILKQKNLLGD